MEAARGIAQQGLQNVQAFHLFGRDEKHLEAAQAAVDELAGKQPGAPVDVVRAEGLAVEALPRLALYNSFLESVAQTPEILTADSASALAGLALRLAHGAPAAQDAGFKAVAHAAAKDAWAQQVASLPIAPGVALGLLATPLPEALTERAAHDAQMLKKAPALSGWIASDLDARKDADSRTHFLHGLEALKLPGALQAGLTALGKDATSRDMAADVLNALEDPQDVEKATPLLRGTLPAAWQTWSAQVAQAIPDVEGRTALLRRVFERTEDKPVQAALAALADDTLSAAYVPDSVPAAVCPALRAAFTQKRADAVTTALQGLGLGPRDELAVWRDVANGKSPAQAISGVLDEMEDAVKRVAARRTLFNRTTTPSPFLKPAVDLPLPTEDAEKVLEIAIKAADEPPKTLADHATLIDDVMQAIPEWRDAYPVLAAMLHQLPSLVPKADVPATQLLDRIAARRPYEPESTGEALQAGLDLLKEPEAVDGEPLAAVGGTIADKMNFWLDRSEALRQTLATLQEGAPQPLQDAITLVQQSDAHSPIEEEEERSKVLRSAVQFLADRKVTSKGDLSELARAMREECESWPRDLVTGQQAAQVFDTIADREHNSALKAGAGLALDIASQPAEYLHNRVDAVFNVLDALPATAAGAFGMVDLTAAALEAMSDESPDQGRLAANGLERAWSQSNGDPATVALADTCRHIVQSAADETSIALVQALKENPHADLVSLAAVAQAVENVPRETWIDGFTHMAEALGDTVYLPDLIKVYREKAKDDVDAAWSDLVESVGRLDHDTLATILATQHPTPAAGGIDTEESGVTIGNTHIDVPQK